jgi:hypothetical protein
MRISDKNAGDAARFGAAFNIVNIRMMFFLPDFLPR